MAFILNILYFILQTKQYLCVFYREKRKKQKNCVLLATNGNDISLQYLFKKKHAKYSFFEQ